MIDKEDNMADFFSKSYAINYDIPTINYGKGFAIGSFGSYESYLRSVSANGQERSIYMGKNIDTDTWTIVDQTTEFAVGDIPKILIRLTNVVTDTSIKVLWQNEDRENILESYYGLPSPYIKRYDWWSLYLIVFEGPKDLQEGNYKVSITSKDKKTNKDLVANIEFSVAYVEEQEIIETDSTKDIDSIDPTLEPVIDSLIKRHIDSEK